jgi:hypothetical protein
LYNNTDPALQIRNTISEMKKGGANYGMLWLDVEGKQYFGTCAQNVALFKAAVQETQRLGVSVGIYASAVQWHDLV